MFLFLPLAAVPRGTTGLHSSVVLRWDIGCWFHYSGAVVCCGYQTSLSLAVWLWMSTFSCLICKWGCTVLHLGALSWGLRKSKAGGAHLGWPNEISWWWFSSSFVGITGRCHFGRSKTVECLRFPVVPPGTSAQTLLQWAVCEQVAAGPKVSSFSCCVTEEKAACPQGLALAAFRVAARWFNRDPFIGFTTGTWLMGQGFRDLVLRLSFPVLCSSVLSALMTGSTSASWVLRRALLSMAGPCLTGHWCYLAAFPPGVTAETCSIHTNRPFLSFFLSF